MCGIAGIASRDGLRDSDPVLIRCMLTSLAHRGPDDEHVLGDHRAVLGSRRLSIIDIEGGRQPLTDESGAIIATQNGEIYNYVELREELERLGHTLRSDGDTETIVHLYEEYGLDFVKRLRGMFAIAIWDSRSGRLVLARDRLGKKPLYWRLANGRLTYGSELKALLEDSDLDRVVDRTALMRYLKYQYVPAPETILIGVRKLPPATVLSWDGGEPTIERYWAPAYEPKIRRDLDTDAADVLSILRESVRLRLRSDVPIGVFLSGGMDSSVVTALAAEASPQPLRTFSVGFDDEGYNELRYAEDVARQFGTVHTQEVVRLDPIGLLPELADHFDEPFGDSSALPTFRVSQLAAGELKVVLTGDGGDESFGGYGRYRAQRTLSRLDFLPPALRGTSVRAARAALRPLGEASLLRRRLALAEGFVSVDRDERYVAQNTIIGAADRQMLTGTTSPVPDDRYLLDVLRAGPRGQLDRVLRADLLTQLPEDFLVKVDRATMANSLEARAPLLDHRLVELMARLPDDRKLAGRTSKVLLRRIAKQLMPAHLVERPKMGFAAPVDAWLHGPLGDCFTDLVLAPDAASRDHLDTSVAARFLDEHRRGIAPRAAGLWSLLMFEVWARRWLRRPVS